MLHAAWQSNLPAFFSFSDPSALDTPFPIFTEQRQVTSATAHDLPTSAHDLPISAHDWG
jgi:hypothetical protein